jgi:hypothetical protein
MKNHFKVKRLGRPSWILGFHVCWETDYVSISQQSYISSLFLKFLETSEHPVSTPMESGKHFSRITEQKLTEEKGQEYRSMIGSLLYLSNGSRPDIAYAVSVLSQYVSNPGEEHYEAGRRILRYLKQTSELALYYKKEASLKAQLLGYSDSDYAGCIDSRRSRSGFVFFYGDCAISWKSRKQGNVTLSTCEAEYYAATEAGKEGIYLSRLCFELQNESFFTGIEK